MTSTGECEFSIIMPCLNEAETIGTCIEKAKRGIDAAGIAAEIVIGDNGSSDGSQEIARQNGARVVDISQRGYGAALFGASQAARGKYIIMGDSDDSYDFTRLERFVKALRDGYDLVMGNRFAGGIAPGAMPWKNRYIGNPVLSGIGRLFFKSPARDFHCGIRGFSRNAFELLDLRTTGMEFASEMVIKATLRGMRITEVPTTLSPDGRSRPPHLRPWRDGWRHLRFMLLYSPRWLFFMPGIALVIGGLGLGFRLYLGPMRIGSVSFDVSTLIYAAAAVLIGFQAVAFSVFTKAYAIEARLVPKDERFARWMGYMQLERGIALGVVLLLAGLVDTGLAVRHWSEAGFGALDPESAVRAVVPAAVAMALGVQVIFGSFVLAVLQLNTRDE